MEEAHAKKYYLISPSGEPVDVYNLRQFCKTNGLDLRIMRDIVSRSPRRKSCSGWKCRK